MRTTDDLLFPDVDGAINLLGAIVRQAVADATRGGRAGADARAWLDSFLGEYRVRLRLTEGRPPGAWTVVQLAQAVGVTQYRISERCQSGEIQAVRVGGRWVIPEAEAQRFISDHGWPPGAWTVAQLAQAVGLHPATITVKIGAGEIPAHKHGRSFAIPSAVAERFIAARQAA